MRVLESKLTPQYKMGKKKHKLRKQAKEEAGFSDSSDDGISTNAAGAQCPHINKAVNFAAVKKVVKQCGSLGECTCCEKLSSVPKHQDLSASLEDDIEALLGEATIWFCLQCGHQGCDRNSREKHALKHFQVLHSSCHSVCVNLSTWVIWCYECDEEVSLEGRGRLSETVEFLRKQCGIPSKTDTLPPASRTPGAQAEVSSVSEPNVSQELSRPMAAAAASTKATAAVLTNSGVIGLPKVKGLSNLGNTCFFNAVMQNLSQTHLLESVLSDHIKKGVALGLQGTGGASSSDSENTESDEENQKIPVDPIEITLPEGGSLTQALQAFFRDMNSASKSSTVSPSSLFSQVCRKAPRFKGFQQQDSHELLRTLLDGMRAEEIKRSQVGILKAFQAHGTVNTKKIDEDTKIKIKEYGRQAKHTFVDAMFGGTFISTVICKDCQMPSHIFEPFLDISLPIIEKPLRPNITSGLKKKDTPFDSQPESVIVPESQAAVEGFLENAKTSKYQQKKAKKQAKAARKAKGRQAKQALRLSLTEEEKCDAEKDEGSSKDPLSDADIEDNIESDASRRKMSVEPVGAETLRKVETSDIVISENSTQDTSCNYQLSSDSLISKQDTTQVLGDTVAKNQHDGPESLEPSESVISNSHLPDQLPGNPVISEQETSQLPGDNLAEIYQEHQVTDHESVQEDSVDMPFPVQCADVVNSDAVNILPQTDCLPSNNELRINHTVASHNTALCSKQMSETDACSYDAAFETQACDKPNAPNKLDESFNTHACEKLDISTNTQSCDNSVMSEVCSGLEALLIDTPEQQKTATVKRIRSHSKLQLKVEAIKKGMVTLGPRYQAVSHECSVLSCLNQFTSAELLTANNRFGCRHCTRSRKDQDKKSTVYTNASKQVLVFCPPAILTLHLKRFQQVGFSLRKLNRHVDFPLTLDLAPFCSSLCQNISPGQKTVLYSLYGVVEHSGRLTGGHYTAYVKVRPFKHTQQHYIQRKAWNGMKIRKLLMDETTSCSPPGGDTQDTAKGADGGRWFYISDSRVNEVTEASVLKCQAYILFYERVA